MTARLRILRARRGFRICEPFRIDDNPTFLGHSWIYLQGSWNPFKQANIAPYRNVMIRVVVNNSTLGVAPESLGRVKALYY